MHISSVVSSPQPTLPRRRARLPRVGGGVVVDGDHVDPGAARQRHRLAKGVRALPVKVPVVDVDQRPHLAVRIGGGDLHLAAEQVHVRRDADGVEVARHGVRGAHLVALHPRRDEEPEVQDGNRAHPLVHGLPGEVEADLGAVALGVRSAVVVVNLHHHPRAGGQQQRGAIGVHLGTGAGRPSAEAARRSESRTAEAAIARPGIGVVERDRGARGVEIGEHVVDDLPVAGHHLDGGDPSVLGESLSGSRSSGRGRGRSTAPRRRRPAPAPRRERRAPTSRATGEAAADPSDRLPAPLRPPTRGCGQCPRRRAVARRGTRRIPQPASTAASSAAPPRAGSSAGFDTHRGSRPATSARCPPAGGTSDSSAETAARCPCST